MPDKTIIGHFSKGEFFSVLPPGFYIFLIFCFCWMFYHHPDTSQKSLLTIIDSLRDEQLKSLFFPLLLFILFASYIFGSISRALPVSRIEQTFPLCQNKFPYFTFSRCEFPYPLHAVPPFHCHFPYPDKLSDAVTTLEKQGLKQNIDLNKGVPPSVFNYWKDFVCIASPQGFEFYQTFETRSRMFAGMIFAGLVGIFGSLLIIYLTWNYSREVGLTLLFFSLALYITFGVNFRRVRAQEAQVLLMIYLAYLQHNKIN